jgi:hypothetical protein
MSFFSNLFHGVVDVLGAIGMTLGAGLGFVAYGGFWVISKISGGAFNPFPNWKHTVLSSALGWGSLFAVFSPYVRTHFVGPTVNQVSRDIGAAAAAGTQIPADTIGGVTSGMITASVPASYGLAGPMTIHDFALGSIIAEPYTTGLVPAADVSNGVLTVPPASSTPGMIGAVPSP